MVEWLAGNRIRGTTAERPNLGLPSGSVGGWVEVGRTTLGSAGSTISIDSLADKRYYMMLSDFQSPSGGELPYFRAGNGSYDSGSNYAMRYSADGGGDITTTSNSNAHFRGAGMGTNDHFDVCYIANLSAKEKLGQWSNVCRSTAGAGTAPTRDEGVFKHVFTSNPYNQIQRLTLSAETYASGSEVVILGWDPSDSHTTNFWEELASVTLGTDGDVLSSGTFTAKKYLWVQAFIKNSGTSARYNTEMTFNGDTGSNYSERRSLDGSSDATSVNQTKIMNSGVTGSNDDLWCLNMFVVNNSATEKLCIGHGFDTYAGSGAGTAPSQRFEKVAKWANTSSQITNITITNSDTSNYDAISELRVWGSD